MATFDDRGIIDRMISGNGLLPEYGEEAPDNPPAVKIVQYENAFGGIAYGVIFKGERDQGRYERTTEFVRNPRVLWTRRTPC